MKLLKHQICFILILAILGGCSVSKNISEGKQCPHKECPNQRCSQDQQCSQDKAKCSNPTSEAKQCGQSGKCSCKRSTGNSSEITMPGKQEMMKKWKEFSTPSSQHKILNALVGNWNHTVEFWMDPNSVPEKSKGTSSIRWTMGGRFLEHSVSGKSMGHPFSGKGVIGYDNATKQYQSIWYDNMSTSIMMGISKYNEATKTFTEIGTASCPFKGSIQYKGVTTLLNSKHFRYELFMEDPSKPGNEVKTMKIEYTKKK